VIFVAILIALALGYLFGSFNSAITTVRLLKHEDVREFGSGNAGLTNTLRCFGKLCALLTLIGDLAKGVVAVLLSELFANLLTGGTADLFLIGCFAGIGAVLGHVFPVYYGFKGGKGVLVGVSIFLALDWRMFLILIGIFAIVLAISKYVSLSSMVAASCAPVVTFVLQNFADAPKWQLSDVLLHAGLICGIVAVIITSHHENIARLKAGTERKFGEKKESQSS
jgi:glycerol-3-phosphate acyltransferase PlsY